MKGNLAVESTKSPAPVTRRCFKTYLLHKNILKNLIKSSSKSESNRLLGASPIGTHEEYIDRVQ